MVGFKIEIKTHRTVPHQEGVWQWGWVFWQRSRWIRTGKLSGVTVWDFDKPERPLGCNSPGRVAYVLQKPQKPCEGLLVCVELRLGSQLLLGHSSHSFATILHLIEEWNCLWQYQVAGFRIRYLSGRRSYSFICTNPKNGKKSKSGIWIL